MAREQKDKADFRYDTGEAKVPWSVIGENTNIDDVAEIIKFLVPQDNNGDAYNRQLSIVDQEIKKLLENGQQLTKLSMGGNVQLLEEKVKKFLILSVFGEKMRNILMSDLKI